MASFYRRAAAGGWNLSGETLVATNFPETKDLEDVQTVIS
jgi:hypothetical protein